MSPKRDAHDLLVRAITLKQVQRRRLARLSILKKVQVIAEMQRAVNTILRATGRAPKPEWPLSAVQLRKPPRK